jgi:hypothetical protein
MRTGRISERGDNRLTQNCSIAAKYDGEYASGSPTYARHWNGAAYVVNLSSD